MIFRLTENFQRSPLPSGFDSYRRRRKIGTSLYGFSTITVLTVYLYIAQPDSMRF